MPGSGSDALASFLAGNGDVLLAYENDSIEAQAPPVTTSTTSIPDDTLLIQNPAAVTTDAAPAAQDFLDFQLSKEGQTLYAKAGFRPVIAGVDDGRAGRQRPEQPVPRRSRRCTRSTRTSVVGTRPTRSSSTRTPGSSPRSSPASTSAADT